MEKQTFALISVSILVALGGCANNVEDAPLSRDEARALNGLGGKADHFDICFDRGWYGDGICDEFCTQPDEDCRASCTTDMDCPQPVCALLIPEACPVSVCEMGACVVEIPDDACGLGERECELCEGESVCVPLDQGCPEIACFEDRCEEGQRECQTCGDSFVCTEEGLSCPQVTCGACGIGAQECATCDGGSVCIPTGTPCPALDCPPPQDRCAEGQTECASCEDDVVICVDEGDMCPSLSCSPCGIGFQVCAGCDGNVCIPTGTPCPLLECPPPPMEICTDTCRYAGDGDCDDGGPGSDYSLCELGTDCGDCGPR